MFSGGIELQTQKELTASQVSLLQALPERVVLPLQQHIGLPAEPVVGKGDRVFKGQTIARAGGYVSVPVHASTSGTVIDIGPYPVPHPAAIEAPCIVIETDGRDEWFEIRPFHEYESVDPKELQRLIRECGIAGLGGAGFPAHVKICEGVDNAVDTLIINGVECEPCITCDDRLIQEKASYVVAGTRMIRHAVQARHCVIALESDMPLAHAALAALVGDDIELLQVPTRYPAGGEKQLIEAVTGKEVPSGGLGIHIGVLVHNVATAAAVYRAVTRGEPQVSRYVTVTGLVERPRNLQVLLGTPIQDCLRTCGFETRADRQIILGGPMMGMNVPNPGIPVIKTTNCILVQEFAPPAREMPCIRCGDCVEVCPVHLLPQHLYRHAKSGDLDAAQRLHLFDCIECGCCAYVCPSHIPLVQYYRHAKSNIAAEERRNRGADHARARFMARNSRTGRGREPAAPETGSEDSPPLAERQAYVDEAVRRVTDRRAAQDAAQPSAAKPPDSEKSS
jgi:electron transport complex protein RnfC